MSLRHRAIERAHRLPAKFVCGTPIWDYDWDILCILDGCRVDTFREIYPEADSYRSVASTSRNWLQRTFDDRDLKRVGYVSANPFAADLDPDAFGHYHLEPVQEVNGIETVPPHVLREYAVSAWERVDIDQLVIHFMQPHVPFRSRPEWFNRFSGTETWGSCAWKRVANGEIDRGEWFNAYRDNLQWVIEEGVQKLAGSVDGTIAVSADHGNGAGEWGVYAHPKECAVPSVRRVPWMTLESVADDVEKSHRQLEGRSLTSPEVEKQLEALGYR